MKIHAVVLAFDGQLVAVAVEMAVAAVRHVILLQQAQNFRAFVAAVARRIVQEAELFTHSCSLERDFQTNQLALENFIGVASGGGILLKEPAACPAQSDIFIIISVVIQNP